MILIYSTTSEKQKDMYEQQYHFKQSNKLFSVFQLTQEILSREVKKNHFKGKEKNWSKESVETHWEITIQQGKRKRPGSSRDSARCHMRF